MRSETRKAFDSAFARLGYQWSESNQEKAYLGWELHMKELKNKTQWDDMTWHLTQIGHPLEYLIAVTPTGPIREALTEANIHFMEAEAALKKAVTLAKEAEHVG